MLFSFCCRREQFSNFTDITVELITVFAGVKVAVCLEEKISKSRGVAFAAKEQKKKIASQNHETQHEFVHVGQQ